MASSTTFINIDVITGINLIGMSVTGTIEGDNIEFVYQYTNDQYETISMINNKYSLIKDKGYWVKTSSANALTFSYGGDMPTTSSVSLQQGWNFIGNSYVNGIIQNMNMIGSIVKYVYNTETHKFELHPLSNTLIVNKGYILYSTEPTEITLVDPLSVLWTNTLGSANNDRGYGVATDSNNNVYITGYTRGELDGNKHVDLGIFLAKYDSSGVKQWTKTVVTEFSQTANGIAIDSDNYVYVTGHEIVSWSSNVDTILIKFDSDGTIIWTRKMRTIADERIFSVNVAIDSINNIYITGYTNKTLDGNTHLGANDIFVIKYNSSGNVQWTDTLGSVNNDVGNAVAIDSNDNIYITGYTTGELDGITQDGFLTKYNSSGVKQWTKTLGTSVSYDEDAPWNSGSDISNAVAIDSNDNIYITGYTRGELDGNTLIGEGDIFLVKYDSSGSKQWTSTWGSAKFEQGFGVAIDSNDNIYITGSAYGGDIDGIPNISTTVDGFLTKYDTSGNRKWTQFLAYSTSAAFTNGISIDANNNVYIIGAWYEPAILTENISQGGIDIILRKYGLP